MKKIINLIFLTALVVLVFAVGGYSKEKNNGIVAKEFRIATQPGPHYAPIFVAKKQGWLEAELKKEKVNVKWISFLAGPPINEAFAAGQVDLGLMGDTPAIIARASGQDLRIIGLASSGPKALAVIVRKNATIKSAKELKGSGWQSPKVLMPGGSVFKCHWHYSRKSNSPYLTPRLSGNIPIFPH
ncbi:MAG TPA: ABC transporter substrate-binding protein [Bacillota bacterium]|nr:ABC transporter substrate-binding protein [Bacillota bacterium]HOL09532.1 ABC transporter substrate-binding protein [Bacillota bacterium]HPO97497.1 ABC transporter substrate-binding protein [Bacillota bacterium]